MVQERQHVKDQQSYIVVSVAYLIYPISSQEHQHRFIENKSKLRRKKHDRRNQGSNFLGGSFSNRGNVRAPIQFRGEN